MRLLTPEENRFLNVFLQEATDLCHSPGHATKALHSFGVEHGGTSP